MKSKTKAKHGMGVFTQDERVYLYYQKSKDSKNKLCIAEGRNAFEFSLLSDEISFVVEGGVAVVQGA